VGEGKVLNGVLMGNPGGGEDTTEKKPSKFEDDNEIELQEMLCGIMDWIDLTHDWDRWRALLNATMNIRNP